VDDSGGAGRWRGGMGMRRQVRIEHDECFVSLHYSRALSSPWGLDGGGEGGRFQVAIEGSGGPLRKGEGMFGSGDRVAVTTPGAGGYGPPRARHPDLVARDLADGKIGAATARDVYGK
jgi:N-methylhydantoinase B